MADIGSDCRLCHELLPKKSRRSIFTDTFHVINQLHEVLGYMPVQNDGMSKYVCGFCFTKLNKLQKIEYDLAHRVDMLNKERVDLIAGLRLKAIINLSVPVTPTKQTKRGNVQSEIQQPIIMTPTPSSTKHAIKHSPTPRKVKRPLILTPEHLRRGTATLNVPEKMNVDVDNSSKKSIGVKLFTPSKVKVLFRAKKTEKVKSRLLPQGHFQNIVKYISQKSPNDRIACAVYKSSLKQSIQKCLVQEVEKEAKALCSTKVESVLRNIKSENLATFTFQPLITEIQERSPMFFQILHKFVRESEVGTAVTAAIALRHRNIHLSAFHHIVSQILDHGGATDETIDTLCKLGLCVSSSAASKQKQDLLQRQSEHIDNLLLEEKRVQEETLVSSAGDPGTLSHLRNIVGRIDVHGADDVIQKYRAHYAFMDDCLDSYIVGAAMHLLHLPEMGAETRRNQPLFDILPDEERFKFIYEIAAEILEKYVKISDEMWYIAQRTGALDAEMNQLRDMFDNVQNKYMCQNCNKRYKTMGSIKRHLKKEHDWAFEDDEPEASKKDHIAIYRASFMKCALLLRDTNDAFKMGDGDRITMNAKFQMLLSRVGNHSKYQLWLFRFLANCSSLLSPRMAYEYKWNCTANLHGSIGSNIPNDNLVELLVQVIKKKVYAQGANASYASVRKAALATQIQDEIKTNMQKQCEKKKTGTRRPAASKFKDVCAIVAELHSANVFDYIPGREFQSFPGFTEVFSRIKVTELHKWISENKNRLSFESV